MGSSFRFDAIQPTLTFTPTLTVTLTQSKFDFEVVIDLHHVGIERINGKIMYVVQCFLDQIKKVEYKCEENLLLLTSTSPSKFGLALLAILQS